MWARIQDGRVAETTSVDPAGRFHPSVVWEPVPPALQPWIDETFVPAPSGGVEPDLPAFKKKLQAALQQRRWAAVERGVVHNGLRFQTDVEARSNLTSTARLAELYEAAFGPGTFSTQWQTLDGFTTLNLQGLYAAGMAVGAYVQACFARQATISAAIDAATDWQTALDTFNTNIDQGWPS